VQAWRVFGGSGKSLRSELANNAVGRMLAYELYFFDKTKGYELIGVLPERRRDPARITRHSVMNWGRVLLGDNVGNRSVFFKRLTIDNHTGRILWVNLDFNRN
jgi:hypothetical protein